MRKLVLGSIALVSAAGLLAGCGAAVGNNIAKFENGSPLAPLTEAPRDGMYGLYGTYDANPMVQYSLNKGDRLGFENRENKNYAVAGDKEVELQTKWGKAFYWREEKAK